LDYKKLQVLYLSNNNLNEAPSIIPSDVNEKISFLKTIYLNNNNLTIFKNSTYPFCKFIKFINLDNNRIQLLEENSLKLRYLEFLSIANNKLKNISSKYFTNLFELKYLNLSHNLIETIDEFSFTNLNKLIELNLDANRIKKLNGNHLYGLSNIRFLHLGNMEFSLSNDILDPIIRTIKFLNLNYNMLKRPEIKCFLIKNLTRQQGNSLSLLYDSIMISSLSSVYDSNKEYIDCDLTLNYLQFNLILNLKNDVEFEKFYDLCSTKLVNVRNLYNSIKSQCRKI